MGSSPIGATMDIQTITEWWRTATQEQRESFLIQIGAYAVSEKTWYVHPEERSFQSMDARQQLIEILLRDV